MKDNYAGDDFDNDPNIYNDNYRTAIITLQRQTLQVRALDAGSTKPESISQFIFIPIELLLNIYIGLLQFLNSIQFQLNYFLIYWTLTSIAD